MISIVLRAELTQIIAIWEAAVRASHHFFTEEDIVFYRRRLLHDYLPTAELSCLRNEKGDILGFVGVGDKNINMLFVAPDAMKNGVGRGLLTFATHYLEADTVDVYEQNTEAIAFYQHCGFETIASSQMDGAGKPYPLLHMQYLLKLPINTPEGQI